MKRYIKASKYTDDKTLKVGRDGRFDIATDSNTPVKFLQMLANDEDYYVRSGVAKNLTTPIKLLEMLANDEEYTVREAVAGNPNTPIKLLEKLSNDNEDWVRRGVAFNINTPITLLEKLSNDRIASVRRAAAITEHKLHRTDGRPNDSARKIDYTTHDYTVVQIWGDRFEGDSFTEETWSCPGDFCALMYANSGEDMSKEECVERAKEIADFIGYEKDPVTVEFASYLLGRDELHDGSVIFIQNEDTGDVLYEDDYWMSQYEGWKIENEI